MIGPRTFFYFLIDCPGDGTYLIDWLSRDCKKLEQRPELRGCTSILVPQGIAHYWAGEQEQVLNVWTLNFEGVR